MNKNTTIEYLHILPANIGRTYRFLKFMHKNFDCEKHRFLILGVQLSVVKNFTRLLEFSDLIYLKGDAGTKKREKHFKEILDTADNIIWHSIDSEAVDIVKILSRGSKYIKKSSWVENGSDAVFDTADPKLNRLHEKVRKSFISVASIFPINAIRIKERYGIDAVAVDYPINETFYKLFEEPTIASRPPHSRLNIQLGTDTRVFNRPKPVLTLLQRRKLKHVKEGFMFLPSNITLKADRCPVKCKPEYIRTASKITRKTFNFSHFYTAEQYIKYMNAMDILIADPTMVTAPEYLLGPVFCGVKLYYSASGIFGGLLSECDSGVNNLRCFSLHNYTANKDSEKIKTLFSCFDEAAICDGWKNFFDSISRKD